VEGGCARSRPAARRKENLGALWFLSASLLHLRRRAARGRIVAVDMTVVHRRWHIGSYNIKFNKTLFKRAVVDAWKWWAISSAITVIPAGGALYACLARDWPIWLAVIALVVFLYFFVGGLIVAVQDSIEYRSMHGRN
jgi:hypothetical protein